MSIEQTYIDKALLQQIADGDEQAFARLYRHYVPRLEPFIRSITKNESLVTEVIQETFTRLWISREKLVDVEFPQTYIYRTASYVTFHYLRRQTKGQQIIAQLEQTAPNSQNNIQDHLTLLDLEKTIREAITRLTPAQQKIFRLSRVDGLKIPEIAELLGVSPNTVKNTLVTSLKSIREFAEKAGYTISILLCWSFF
ncbi:MAG: RNA polymerase sigma factor [Pseudobacter sp.]|uniref:RNA polymerase sigma factor n=1 Tax=Pseudobacter sp. TaxID=2045420 RepID=UPI003F7DB44A